MSAVTQVQKEPHSLSRGLAHPSSSRETSLHSDCCCSELAFPPEAPHTLWVTHFSSESAQADAGPKPGLQGQTYSEQLKYVKYCKTVPKGQSVLKQDGQGKAPGSPPCRLPAAKGHPPASATAPGSLIPAGDQASPQPRLCRPNHSLDGFMLTPGLSSSHL